MVYIPGMAFDHNKLAAEVDKRGWTQAELARRAEMSPQQWSNLASGRITDPSFWTVQRMANAIGCTLDQLANDDPPRKL